jgi:site-specific DNA recombinase
MLDHTFARASSPVVSPSAAAIRSVGARRASGNPEHAASKTRLSPKERSAEGASRARIRCAIYTRKSSEEGLDQEFNSLDAQREACEAFIKSQRHEGWIVLSELYDDPGFSGATMERPALRRLLADVAARRIDAVVVYKVDRLTRSLSDFAKIVEIFDLNTVSFVSVTQAFNTTTSMGRLTLNVLLSFAQFEREVTGERIRDKIAASKKKGLWMGGLPSLGYDVKDRKLIVVEEEAERVRLIFRRYLDLGCVRALRDELLVRGVVSKRRVFEDGRASGGLPFSRGALYHLLQNPIYRGMIVHKDKAYPGEHAPIVDHDLWDAVQARLQANGVERSDSRNTDRPAILTGVLFDAAGSSMTPTHAVKKGVRYRYYVSRHLVTGAQSGDSGQRLPAPGLESLVIARLRAFLGDPSAVDDALPVDRRDAPARKRAAGAAAELIQILDDPSSPSRGPFLRAVLSRVQVRVDAVEIELCARSLAGMLTRHRPAQEISMSEESVARSLHLPNVDDAEGVETGAGDPQPIRLVVPTRLKRRGNEMKFIVEGGAIAEDPRIDENLVRLIVRARILAERFQDNPAATIEGVAAGEGFGATYAGRLLRLTSLAPDIVTAIFDGRQPPELTANALMADARLPLEWSAQRAVLGFPARAVVA